MIFRRAVFVVLVSFLLIRPAFAASDASNVLRVHWLGLSAVSADTNAAHLMAVWQLPQTKTLVAQTLDKLSRWPGHGVTNAASARLRPLLDDLVSNEFSIEISADTNSSFAIRRSQLLLALRLPSARAGLWQTNLAVALTSLTGVSPVVEHDGWTLSLANAPRHIQFVCEGSWTLISCGLDEPVAKSEFARNLRSGSARGPWLDAEISPTGLAAAIAALDLFPSFQLSTLNPQPSTSLPSVHLTVTGRNGDLHTHATLDRDKPYPLDLPAWEIPTNLIRGSLTSFAAARGFGAWLAAQSLWQKTGLAPAPDQLAYWSRDGIPFQTYVAAPLTEVSNQLARLFPKLVEHGNPWLTTNAEGSFAWSMVISGILWNDANIVTPFVYGDKSDHHSFILAGLYPPQADKVQPPPARIRQAIHDHPNLLFAELEGTGSRVEDGFFILQNFRMVFHKPQMPHEAVGTQWLKKSEQSFGETFTTLCLANLHRLEFERDSTVGLNAFELHLLADWLESPQFPRGLHTFLASPDIQ